MLGRTALAILVALTASARAQVIEVGAAGAVTYDRPMVFTGGVPRPVAPPPALPDAGLARAVEWVESRGRADAVSPKGALGPMQLMPATARELGVDPRDPAQNRAGGIAYLARQLARFGSVPLALAAYNAGPGAVLRHGGVPPFAETRRYVAAVLARWRGDAATPTPEPAFLIEVPAL